MRVAIIGLGFGCRVLLPAFRSDPRCLVTTICATNAERVGTAAQQFDIPDSTIDWRKVITSPAIDAIVIATPAAVQSQIAMEAIDNHKPVFLEKPVALSQSAANELHRLAQRKTVPNMVDFEFCEIGAFQQLREQLQVGLIGKLERVRVSWNQEGFQERNKAKKWKFDTASGGGVLNLFGSHTLYYLEWLLGPIERLHAKIALDESKGFETSVNFEGSLSRGVPVEVSLETSSNCGNFHTLEFFGSKGLIALKNISPDSMTAFSISHVDFSNNFSTTLREAETAVEGRDARIDIVAPMAKRFITWVLGGVETRPTLLDGHRVQQLISAIRESDHTGRIVSVAQNVGSPT